MIFALSTNVCTGRKLRPTLFQEAIAKIMFRLRDIAKMTEIFKRVTVRNQFRA